MKQVELNDNGRIYFKWLDDTPGGKNIGRAEFGFCPVWKRKRIKEIFIYKLQQRDITEHYHVECHGNGLSISSWTGLDDPKIWMFFKCSEHKTMGMRVYVPSHSEYVEFHNLSTVSLVFGKTV